MKKIFTFLFFAAIISSAAMAQDNRHGQYRNSSADNRNQSPVYQADNGRGYSNPSQNQGGYQGNDHLYNQHENGYGYDNDKRYEERNNGREFRNSYPVYGHDRRVYNDRYRHNRSRVLLSIHFGKRLWY